jgi:hypothetical protein
LVRERLAEVICRVCNIIDLVAEILTKAKLVAVPLVMAGLVPAIPIIGQYGPSCHIFDLAIMSVEISLRN